MAESAVVKMMQRSVALAAYVWSLALVRSACRGVNATASLFLPIQREINVDCSNRREIKMAARIAVVGATGNLGKRIVGALHGQGADVLALARKGVAVEKMSEIASPRRQGRDCRYVERL